MLRDRALPLVLPLLFTIACAATDAADVSVRLPFPLVGIAAGDFDGDGAPDVAAVARGRAPARWAFGVLPNRGGLLEPPALLSLTGEPKTPPAVGDFDGDGRLDAAVGEDGFVTLLMNQRDGSFLPRRLPLGVPVDHLAAAELDDRPGLDLAIATSISDEASTVSLFFQDEGGAFSRRRSFDYTVDTSALAVADFDGDGDPDVGAAAGSSVSLLVNQGSGGFVRQDGVFLGEQFLVEDHWTTRPAQTTGLVAADLDGDGRVDLAAADNNLKVAHLARNDGDLSFTKLTDDLAGGGAQLDVAALDFDGDGDLDLVRSHGGGLLSYLANEGGFHFVPRGGAEVEGSGRLAAADLDGDGRADVITRSLDAVIVIYSAR